MEIMLKSSAVLPLLTVFVSLVSFVSFSFSFELDGSSSSFAKFSSWVPCHNGSITFEFKTQLKEALLLYTGGGMKQDYYELSLITGIMHLKFKINGKSSMLTVGQNLNDNEWHKVSIYRDNRMTTLQVDKQSYIWENKKFDPKVEPSIGDFLFIGGLPLDYNHKLAELPLTQVIFQPKLRGSVRNLFYSNCGKDMSKPTMDRSSEIILDNDECLKKDPCMNEGICVMRNRGVKCDCSRTGYSGEYCETELQPAIAMFQGAQYLMYDLTNRGDPIFSNQDQLNMTFKTTHGDGLLFYTGEGKDFMTVSLKNGTIHVAIELGSGAYHGVANMNGFHLDDGQWHHLAVKRKSRQVEIYVDGSQRVTGTTTGQFEMLSSNVLYVGGSPNPAELQGSNVRNNFRGCMQQVQYKGDSITLELTELAKKGHDLISVVGDVVFGECEDVIESLPVTFSTPESFIAVKRWDVRSGKGSSIRFRFRTTESDGLLMYNSGSRGSHGSDTSGSYRSDDLDFFALEIIDGYFYLVLDLGTGAIKEKPSRTRVDDGNLHSVEFQYNGRTGHIMVDADQARYSTPGQGSQLDLEGMLFIGGMDFKRHNMYRVPKELYAGTLQYGFVGCFQDLVINDNKIDLMTVARKQGQRDIVSNCKMREPQCGSLPCAHRGECKEGWNRFVCDCRATEYTGDTCHQVAPTLSFSEAQYMMITLPQQSATEAEDISLRFRSLRADGLLFMTVCAQSDDSIELYMEMGACKLTVSLGTGSKTLTIGHDLNDDQWHTVFVKRRGQNMQLKIDELRPVTDVIPQMATTVHITHIMLGSPGPMQSDVSSMSNAALVFDDPGINIQNDRNIIHHTGFVGSMQQFIFNGKRYLEMAQNEENSENIDVTARFDNGESVIRDPVTFESRESYVSLPKLHANEKFKIDFKFKTSQNTGLILYNGHRSHDFLALELYEGYLFYIYDMGGGSERIRVNTPEPLNDNVWHGVSLYRPHTEEQSIRVDANPPTVENMKDYSARRFDLRGPLYIGGVIKTRYNSLPEKILSKYGFLGCMASLDINDHTMNILDVAESVEQSVVNGCSSSEMTCHASSCYNGGRCIQEWKSYRCDCEMTSFTGASCTEDSVTYQFGVGRGLIVFEHLDEDARPSTNSDILALGLQTIQNFGVLVRVDSADTDDFIEMSLMEGKILVVYNMGQLSHPIGEHFFEVNDGKYHVIKFVRSGPNATLQVDNWSRNYKNPSGKQMNVFNNQARVWIGGQKRNQGEINNAFLGTISGFVFNNYRILDYVKANDPRVRVEGDVTLVPARSQEVNNIQSTQGHTKNDRLKQWIAENSTRKKLLTHSVGRSSRFFLIYKNLLSQNFSKTDFTRANTISGNTPQKKNKHRLYYVRRNNAQNPYDHSKFVTMSTIGTSTGRDHLIGGDIDSIYSSGHGEIAVRNDETDIEYSGYPVFGSGDDEDELVKGDNFRRNPMVMLTLLSPLNKDWHRTGDGRKNVRVGTLERPPFARDDRFRMNSYPKDRGKEADGVVFTHQVDDTSDRMTNSKHSSNTTPRQAVTDDIIFSGTGPCYNSDDDDDCTSSGFETTTDDIITPTVVIKHFSTPKPKPKDPTRDSTLNRTCKGKDCPTELIVSPDTKLTTDNPNLSTQHPGHSLNTTGDPGESTADLGNGHLSVFLIVGIGAGVSVALIILCIALYKFRSGGEGVYRVDESQNFAYLEAKKQQTNGSAVTNVGNGKAGGKKKDVKEWYV